MTYGQALKLRESIDDYIIDGGIEYEILIAPLKYNDLIEFIKDYRIYEFTDESCLNYSSDGKFDIYGFHFDGAIVLHHHITKFQSQQ